MGRAEELGYGHNQCLNLRSRPPVSMWPTLKSYAYGGWAFTRPRMWNFHTECIFLKQIADMLLNLQIWENFCSGEECYILQNSCIFYLTRFCILQYIFYLSRLTSQGVRKARDNYQLTCIYEQHDPPYIMTDPNLGRIHLIMEFCYFGENLIWSNSAQQRECIVISHQPHCILTTVCRSQLSVGIIMQGCSGGIEGRLAVSTAGGSIRGTGSGEGRELCYVGR